MKTCANCKSRKPLDEFGLQTESRDGRQRYCRECMSNYGAYFRKSMTRNMRFRIDSRDYKRIRPLTEREIDEFVAAVNRKPPKPIRLKVLQ